MIILGFIVLFFIAMEIGELKDKNIDILKKLKDKE